MGKKKITPAVPQMKSDESQTLSVITEVLDFGFFDITVEDIVPRKNCETPKID